jgi:hypothetical protein
VTAVTLSIVDLLREDSGARFIALVIILFTVFAIAVFRSERRR